MKSKNNKFKKPVSTILTISLLASIAMSFGLYVEKNKCEQKTTKFYGVEIARENSGTCTDGNKEVLIGGLVTHRLDDEKMYDAGSENQTDQAFSLVSAYVAAILIYMTLFLSVSMIIYWSARQTFGPSK